MQEEALDLDQLERILKATFGFDAFRPGQREAIVRLLQSGRLLSIQPTGYGKSLLYQLPSCLLGGMTLVISPLLALMRDQVKQLNERFHISAAAINTDQSEEQNAQVKQDALAGKLQILFVAPEQLDHVDRFAFLLQLDVRLLVIDEAHCISTWGHDFRPSYRQILHLFSAFVARRPQIHVLGLTATANQRVESDIKRQLTLDRDVVVMREGMDRPNLSLSVIKERGLAAKLAACIELISSLEGSGLIYCATRENVELVAECLQRHQLHVAPYHAGFDPEDKKRLQEQFLVDRYKALVATNALGMGIDKGNLRFVIHFDIPGSITAYYQEVGRSGRDGLPAQGVLLFDPSDQRVQEYFIESAIPFAEHFEQVLSAIATAEVPPNLSAIKRATGLHPTRVNVIIAELLEQGFLTKKSREGVQVYACTCEKKSPDLSRYEHQRQAKEAELDQMLHYARQEQTCRMAFLRAALGDLSPTSCNHCDCCKPGLMNRGAQPELEQKIAAWLQDRPFPIAPIALHKLSAGMSLLDSKMRSPLFVRFMKERQSAASFQEMESELIELLLKQFGRMVREKECAGIVPIPSRTWRAQESILQLLAGRFHLPLLRGLLEWKEAPLQRQGELLNNDQRHHNVHQRMRVNRAVAMRPGALILLDDYIGSNNTLKEAARALRAEKTIQNEIIPFTIASVKWHLGKPGFS